MHYSLVHAAALMASASLTVAAPAPHVGRSTFHVEQVANGKVYKNGPLSLLKTYNKFAKIGAKAPSDVVSAAAAAQSGSVEADPEQEDVSYLSPVTVGEQTLHLDFDTGSADLWVFSTLTPSSESSGHTTYDPSTGKKLDGATWDITYGDGSGASGTVYTDKVVVGEVTATSQAVEAATSVASQFTQDTNNDGLLGLAFSSINTVQPEAQTTFFDTVKSSLEKQVFTADLQKGKPGSYDFGFIDDSKYTGDITYVDVDDSQGFWGFNAGGYAIGSDNASTGNIGNAIADTGTTLLYVPSSVATAYYKQIDGASYDSSQGGYTFPSSSDVPDFTVTIGGTAFTVPGSYIKYAPVSSGGSTYFGGLQPNTGIGLTIFGDIFLKSVFAVFDASQSSPRLGFAAKPT